MKRLLLAPLLIALTGCSSDIVVKTDIGEEFIIKKSTVKVIEEFSRKDLITHIETQIKSKNQSRIDKQRPPVNWKGLASASDSLVIYMGLHNLAYIVEELIAGGLHPATPAAVIQQGTVAGQRCLKAPLQQLAQQVQSQGLAAPSIVVVGAVVDEQVAACAPQPAEAVMPISFESSSSSVQ